MMVECVSDSRLRQADLVEYNQCQAMLRDLYALDLPGSRDEFLAYRILYLCYTRDRSGESCMHLA